MLLKELFKSMIKREGSPIPEALLNTLIEKKW